MAQDEGENPPAQRFVAGLWCGDVLARLPDLLDGSLDPDVRSSLADHVAGCDWCERFGGTYGALVGRLAAAPVRAPAGLAARLRGRLARETG